MTIRNLDQLLAPTSVALVGASTKPGSVGFTVARNLTEGGFAGKIYFVNPKYAAVCGVECFPRISDLPEAPSLAIVATPVDTIPSVIAELGKLGTRAACVITAGLGPVKQAMLNAARPHCLRVLGPNCLGLLMPNIGLNGSFSHRMAPKGDLAFLSQSGALVTTVIDWAADRNIGFSHVISLGDMADVDFGDLLDYFAGERQSRAILMYMESLTDAPKFISAARRAARVKPVIVVKSGRHAAGARAAMSHTGALAGSDAAYEAAFRRTGVLRVKTLPDLFAAAEMLAHRPHLLGERLMVLTNGGGAGVLFADELQDAGGTPAVLSPEIRAKLDKVLPSAWSRANPVDIIGDAGPERYRAALGPLLSDPESDAILIMQCPTALASSLDNAKVVVDMAKARQAGDSAKPLFTCWLGDGAARESRALFAQNEIATFDTPGEAVTGFMQLVHHARAQKELMQTPPAGASPVGEEGGKAADLIGAALVANRTVLTAAEAKSILQAEGIPVAETLIASSAEQVSEHAARLLRSHDACVVKILSRDISHKSDVGGVRLGIESASAAEMAANEMLARVKQVMPQARVDGFMVEPMIRRPGAHEIIIGVSEDATFGPLLLFGAGGTAVEVIADRALALPPLDAVLARQLIGETKIARLLAGYRDRPAVDFDALVNVLLRVSQLVVRYPAIRELDINPLLVDESGVLAIDARIRIADPTVNARRPLAIRPYPSEWATTREVQGIGTVQLRPVRPDDERLYEAFFSKITAEDVRRRFFTPKVDLSHRFLARLTQIDYAREMAFVAVSKSSGELLGVVRLVLDPDRVTGEYGIIVRSDLKGRGLGWQMMAHLIDYARSEGVRQIAGIVLAENTTMIEMASKMGFHVTMLEGDSSSRRVTLDIAEGVPAPPHAAAFEPQS